MPVAYLGFLETLQSILGAIFNDVLAPVISIVLETLFKLAGTLLYDILAKLLVRLLVILLKMLDFLASIFDIFSGVRYVHYYDNATHISRVNETIFVNGVTTLVQKGDVINYQQTYVLDMFLQYGPVSRAFLLITFFSATLALILTIYAVGKSISDMTIEGKNPVGKVLGRAIKAAGTFILVPLMAFVLLQLSTIVVVEVSDMIAGGDSVSGGSPPTMGTIIFLTGSLNAGNTAIANPSFTDSLRIGYYNGEKSYTDMDQVEQDFDLKRFDTVTCIVCGLLVILIMFLAIFLFVQRSFEVLILYLVAPLFVSAIPLDDGNMFSKWRELFLAKLFAGFGTVFTLKLFLVLVPLISGPSITLYPANLTINAILKMFIVIGGAWAAYKSQHLFLQILHPEAAQAAQANTMAMFGMAGAFMRSAGSLAPSMGKKGGSKDKGKGKGKDGPPPTQQQLHGSQSSGAKQESQAFTGGR